MDINIQITGEYIKQSGKTAGAAGSANVNRLLLSFDDSWSDFAKKVIFHNAKGENPVEITLTTDYLVAFLDGVFSEYAVPIPAEPLEYAGEMQFAIRGYNDVTPAQIAKSVTGKLSVLQSVSHLGTTTPADPTPTQAEQLQSEIDNLLGDMSTLANTATTGATTATTKAGEAAASAAAAATSEDNAAASAASVATSESNAAASALSASGSASTATTKAGEAATSASAATGSAADASTSAGSAASSATSAGEAATAALGYMEDAEAASDIAIAKAAEASTSATNAGNSATAAAGSATSAGNAKTAAESARDAAQVAQVAAEAARDEASAIVGGDYLTTTAAASTYETKTDSATNIATAKSEAISTAAADATSKANAAQSNAISAAATDATTKANTAETNAKTASVPTTRTVNGKALSADITLAKADVGLGNVDNTADADKPVSTAQAAAIAASGAMVKIADFTVITAATAIDIILPYQVAQADYSEVKVTIISPINSDMTTLAMRFNDLTTNIYFSSTAETIDSVTATATSSISIGIANTSAQIRGFSINLLLSPRGIAGDFYYRGWAPGSRIFVTGYRSIFASNVINLDKINISSSANIPVGTKFIIYGVKA